MAIFRWKRTRASTASGREVDEVAELVSIVGDTRGEADGWKRALIWQARATSQLDSTEYQLFGLREELEAVIPSMRKALGMPQLGLAQLGLPRQIERAPALMATAAPLGLQFDGASANPSVEPTATSRPMSLAEQYGVQRPILIAAE